MHCWFGGDRDGMLEAAYRIAFAGCTAEEAVHEMRAFRYKEFLHPNMKWYVWKFPERVVKSPVLAPYWETPKREEQLPRRSG
jgi:protein-tyrosine phosphatase